MKQPEEYIPLIKSIIKPFIYNNNYDDLYQEAYIALLETIEKYDNKYNTKFSTFAYLNIRWKILKYINSQHYELSLSVDPLTKEYDVFKDILPKLKQENIDIIDLRRSGMTYKEIGDYYNKSTTWAFNRVKHIINLIKSANIEEEEIECQ